jgi:hypothetical protein
MAGAFTLNSTVKLKSGYEMPLLGFGVSSLLCFRANHDD